MIIFSVLYFPIMAVNKEEEELKNWQLIEERITCMICGELYTDPKTLSCLHTFCRGCLEPLVEGKEGGQGSCPLCLEPLPPGGMAKIPTNSGLNCLVKIFYRKEDNERRLVEAKCGTCDEFGVPVISWCLQCQRALCSGCFEQHNKSNEFRGHNTATIKDYVREPKLEVCKKHAKQPLKFYCRTCKIAICQDCALKGHVQHTFELYEVILKEMKEEPRRNQEEPNLRAEDSDNEEPVIPNGRSEDQIYKGKYEYAAMQDDELSFKKGELLYVINDEGDWWLAENMDSSKEGLIPKNYVAKNGSLEAEDYFFGPIKRLDAEDQLMHSVNEYGSFLVRNSEKTPGAYSIAVRDTDRVRHFKIYHDQESKFYIDKEQSFNSVQGLISFYCKNSTGLGVRLKKPCLIAEQPKTTNDLSMLNEAWETQRSLVIPVKKIGVGQFGEVWEGSWNDMPVAIKIQPINADTVEFTGEIEVLKDLNHDCIIKLLAVCTKDVPIYVITEFMNHGSLLEYLKGGGSALGLHQKIDIARQVATGMAYLERRHIVHCDIAARNVLVSEDFDKLVCKIANFGLAQFLSEDIYEAPSGTKFSPKWAAPEATISSHFSIKSDVWSYGILLYELITDGDFPYLGMSNAQVVEALQSGYRMPCPVKCPKQLYQVMRSCWIGKAVNRPTFHTLQWIMEDYFINDNNT